MEVKGREYRPNCDEQDGNQLHVHPKCLNGAFGCWLYTGSLR